MMVCVCVCDGVGGAAYGVCGSSSRVGEDKGSH